MYDLEYCKLCLVTGIKMFDMKTSILEAYSKLLQLPLFNQEQCICYECAALLLKYKEFYDTCNRAHNVLTHIQSNNPLGLITKEAISTINRKLYNLQSKLSLTPTQSEQIEPHGKFRVGIEENSISIKTEGDSSVAYRTVASTGAESSDKQTCSNILYAHVTDEIESNNECIIDDFNLAECVKNTQRPRLKRKVKAKNKHEAKRDDEEDNIELEDRFSDEDCVPLSKRFLKTENSKTADKAVRETKIIKTKKKAYAALEGFGSIVVLTPEDARTEVLLRKETSNYKNCPFKCDLCYRGYEKKDTFDNHMKKHSEENGSFECEYCHVRFSTRSSLYHHFNSRHRRKFKCNHCDYVTFAMNQVQIHINTHKGKKYPCTECDATFTMPNTLLMHKRVKHVTACVCALCGSAFATPRGVAQHRAARHRRETNEGKGPKCEECSVQFATEMAWKRHLIFKHKVSNGCEVCGETFPDATALKVHWKTHGLSRYRAHYPKATPKLTQACPVCKKVFPKGDELGRHLTAQHPAEAARAAAAQWVCEFCGKEFKTRLFLTYHRRTHTGERPLACKECGKRFAHPTVLYTHRLTHRPRRRRHQCHLCPKGFALKNALNKHVKAHLGIRPHKCHVCGKGFLYACLVRTHVKYTHDKEPWPKRDRRARGGVAGKSAGH